MNGSISSSPKTCSERWLAAEGAPGDLPIGGVTPFTTIDYPGKLAAVFYTQGCAWRCGYCYNRDLWGFGAQTVERRRIEDFLDDRKGFLDGIVFSGGEPTAHGPALAHAMNAVKTRGFLVGLHTAGMFPEALGHVLPLCDWVGMDIKAPFDAYERITGVAKSGLLARASAEQVVSSGVEYEFRTTVHPEYLSEKDILSIANELGAMGARHYRLQAFFDPERFPSSNHRLFLSPVAKQSLAGRFSSFLIRE